MPEAVQEELERLLSSPDFQASEKRRTFLRYIVEETLAGRSGTLKGYTIAVAVFGRDASFDAQTDPVVRVEARRLRRDLDSYYVNAASEDSVRFSIPKGAYIPHFENTGSDAAPSQTVEVQVSPDGLLPENTQELADSSHRKARHSFTRPVTMGVAVIVVLFVATAVWLLGVGSHFSNSDITVEEPSVLVLPFQSLDSSRDGTYLAAGISQELINDLMKFPGFRLYSPVAGMTPVALERSESQQTLGQTTYIVRGSVQLDVENVLVSVQMVLSPTGEVLWSNRYERPQDPAALIKLRHELSASIATALGQPYGYIQSDLLDRLTTPDVLNMQSYVCVLRAHYYRRSFTQEQFDSTMDCLESAINNDPGYSDAWAMLGWLHLDAGRFDFQGSDSILEEYDQAYQAASQALLLEADNTLAVKALSAINHYMGNYEESERLARKAVALNPNDPDSLAHLGWRLAVRGNFDEGTLFLDQAIERTIDSPGWYYHLLAIEALMEGDFERMLTIAQRSAVDGSEVSQMLIAIASEKLGQYERSQHALDKLPKTGLLATDPAAFLYRHGATEEITETLVAALAQAHRVARANSGQFESSTH